MEVFTGDARYRAIEDEVLTDLKEGVEFSVCEFAQRCEDRGIKKGMNRGIKEGMNRGIKEGMNRGIKKGFKDGIDVGIQALVSTLREYNASDNEIVAKIMEQFQISKSSAKKYVR